VQRLTLDQAPYAAPRAGEKARHWWHGWGVLEWFIVVQYLSTALFFLPGAQNVRMILRVMPYLLAGAMLFLVRGRRDTGSLPPGARLVAWSLLLLSLFLLRTDSQPLAGFAQLTLQACIAAPLFWVARLIRTPRDFERMMMVVLACNAVHAGVGLLQVFWPDTFLPLEFNRTALSMDSKLLQSLSYMGADGHRIVRPPGLSDMPGGAASGGTLCALFGIAVATRARANLARQAAGILLAALGFSVLYFSHVRSVLMMTIVALLAFAFLSARQGRPAAAIYTVGIGALVVLGVFFFAVSVGGEAVQERFSTITDRGLVESYQAERGNFVMYTLREVLPEYPFGAGVGRWGVMNLYFGDPNKLDAKGLYAEIQMTGWIYDGGFILLLLYGTAVLLALRYAFRVAERRLPGALSSYAPLVFCALLLIAGMTMAGPSFNTQLGIQYWTLTAALHAVMQRLGPRPRPDLAPDGGRIAT
jgi:hypothetical protein